MMDKVHFKKSSMIEGTRRRASSLYRRKCKIYSNIQIQDLHIVVKGFIIIYKNILLDHSSLLISAFVCSFLRYCLLDYLQSLTNLG